MIDIEKVIETYSPEQLAALKIRLETNYLAHAKFFLSLREKQNFIVGNHHAIIAKTMQKVYDGYINRLIINIPPSYTKTELCVIQFTSFSFANNPACKFLHVSGGETLPLDSSSKIKEQVMHPISRMLWNTQARDDTRAKGYWKTNKNGSFYAVSSGGQIMGFRAGRSKEGFQGAILIDDPQKPEDMHSEIKREYFINRYQSEIKHRIDNRNTPIIVVMQRIHEDDFSGWLLKGGTGEYWHHLCLPAIISA